MTAINLQDGLEAWYEFDSNYFDSQRNVIEDQSGYGRYAEASGGPTVGVNGPNDFEAASFDGSDDEFNGQRLGIDVPNKSFAVTSIFRAEAGDDRSGLAMAGSNADVYGLQADIHVENLQFGVNDGSNDVRVKTDINYNTWYVATGVLDATQNECRLYLDSELRGTEGGLSNVNDINEDPFNIGAAQRLTGASNVNYKGDVAMVAVHSRVLSDAEIEYLNDLTAPRRQML